MLAWALRIYEAVEAQRIAMEIYAGGAAEDRASVARSLIMALAVRSLSWARTIDGFAANRAVIERMIRWSFDDGLIDRLVEPEELFQPELHGRQPATVPATTSLRRRSFSRSADSATSALKMRCRCSTNSLTANGSKLRLPARTTTDACLKVLSSKRNGREQPKIHVALGRQVSQHRHPGAGAGEPAQRLDRVRLEHRPQD